MKSIKFWQWSLMWMGIVVVQALLTNVHDDEAYYWIFSTHLDWAYFDHPPVMALSIYLSDILFNGILSIRFFTIVVHLATLLALWKLVRDTTEVHVQYFWLFILALPLIHIYSFVTTADAFLLFGEVLFFLAYRKVLHRGSLADYLFWGITMAFLMYAKYHGVLVILFTVISNFRLFLNPRLYMAGFLALCLFLPHLIWQWNHDFASFRYHLFDRHASFQLKYPFEFLVNVLLVFNPLLIGFLFRLVRRSPTTKFNKSLYYVLIGTLLFFFLNGFRTHVQPQWLLICYVPYILLGLGALDERWKRHLPRVFWISLPILIFMHLSLIFNILPIKTGVHEKDTFFSQVDSISVLVESPPVFYDSYRNAANFGYQKQNAYVHSFNAADSRKNQFSFLWNDTVYHGKPVLFAGNEMTKYPIQVSAGLNAVLDTFYCHEKLEIEVRSLSLHRDTARIAITISNPYPFDLAFSQRQFQMAAFFRNQKKWIRKPRLIFPRVRVHIPAGGKVELGNLWFLVPENAQPEEFGLAPRVDPFPFSTIWNTYEWAPDKRGKLIPPDLDTSLKAKGENE